MAYDHPGTDFMGRELADLLRFVISKIGEHCTSDTERQSCHENTGNCSDDGDPNIDEYFDEHFH